MMRETRRADEITPKMHVKQNGLTERVTFVQTEDNRTLLVFAGNTHALVSAGEPVEIATDEEAQQYEDRCARERVADALRRLARTVLEKRLPVPESLRDVKVDFNLDDNADLSGWSEVLRRTPVKHTPSLLPSMSSDELGLDVCITGGTWEFGPELADSIEHRDAVGAFPVVAPAEACDEDPWGDEVGCTAHFSDLHRCKFDRGHGRRHICHCGAECIEDEPKPQPKPAPVGWPLGDGHRPQVDDDVMRADRYSEGQPS